MDEKKTEMKSKFDMKLKDLRSNPNCALLTIEKYNEYIKKIKFVKNSSIKKTPYDYYMLRHYDVLEVDGTEKLIFPMSVSTSVKYYVSADELFEILFSTHTTLGHGGRDRMVHELGTRYKNITQQQIMIFLRLCETCEQKRSGCKKGVVVKPMVFDCFNSRAQLDLIDMQTQADGNFRFIFVYQDHLTKFVNLRPLTSKRADEVAYTLLDVFLNYGAPGVLQSDNGREFCNSVINSLVEMWPELRIVHGKPRHSQSQGSVERANQDVENMLFTWMSDNATTKWSEGLKFIQFMKNRSYHSGIRTSPYEALFGQHPRVGLQVSALPDCVLKTLRTEEDLEKAMSSRPAVSAHPDTSTADTSPTLSNERECTTTFLPNDDKLQPSSVERPCTSCGTDVTPLLTSLCAICLRQQSICKKRKQSKDSLLQQAKQMKLQSDKNFPDPKVGDTVRVHIPQVDRGKTDARNVLACILEVTDDKFFKLGTRNGVLKQLYVRSQFQLCHETFLNLEDIPLEDTSLRSVASAQAQGNGQGFIRCSCSQKCNTRRCLCLKNGILCNSKCHNSSTCCNK